MTKDTVLSYSLYFRIAVHVLQLSGHPLSYLGLVWNHLRNHLGLGVEPPEVVELDGTTWRT